MKLLIPLILVVFCSLFHFVGGADSSNEEGLTIAFSRGLFADVSVTDATAATKIWAAELKRKRGFAGPADALSFNDVDALLKSWKRKEIELIVLMTPEYLEMKKQVKLEPRFVPMRVESAQEESLLIVHKDSGIQAIRDLAGTDLLILSDARGHLGRMWLELKLFEQGQDTIETFFRSSKTTTKSSQTVLPVFFGKADACLVPSTGFGVLCELNPQLRRDLVILERSPAMVPSVLCIRSDYRADLKEGLVDALLSLHEEPRGQQILMMFKVDRLVPFEEHYLESARELVHEHTLRWAERDNLVSAR